MKEERFHEVALSEMRAGIRRDGLWAQALVATHGNEQRAVAEYIKLRVASLRDETYVAERVLDQELGAGTDPSIDVDADPRVTDHGSYFDFRGFFVMLSAAVALIAFLALMIAALTE